MDTNDGEFVLLDQSFGLNDNGQIAFAGVHAGGGIGLYRTEQEGRTTIAREGENVGRMSLFGSTGTCRSAGPDINDAGQVVFVAAPADVPGDGEEAVFVGNGQTLEELDRAAAGSFGKGFGFRPDINNSGDVLYVVEDDPRYQLVLHNGQTATVVAEADPNDPDADFSSFRLDGNENVPALDDSGRIAVTANTATEGGVFVIHDGAREAVALESTRGLVEVGAPRLNNNGEIAFGAMPGSGFDGVFLGPDVAYHRVARTGDVIDGTGVVGTCLYRGGFNDHGDVAFLSVDEDGSRVVLAERQRPTIFYAPSTGELFVDRDRLDDVVGLWLTSQSGSLTGEHDADFPIDESVSTDEQLELKFEDALLPAGRQSLGEAVAAGLDLDFLADDLRVIGSRDGWPRIEFQLEL
ncbi:MAG: choice-of-anchor tandem repeat NxxGxxAF-containing protein, partial [Planctomycetota bacterium]